MRYRLQRHDGTDCSATMVPITVLRMVPIQRYRQNIPCGNEWNLFLTLVKNEIYVIFRHILRKIDVHIFIIEDWLLK